FSQRGYKKFIAYFQSFSNTYAPKEKLEEIYSSVLDFPEIIGIAIGTRPDCINEEVINLLKHFQSLGYYLWVELGLQTIHNETLKKINRGHTYEEFVEAYQLLKENGIPLCIHLIFGLPGEDKEMMLETVKSVAALLPHGIKFHALYIIKEAPIARLYENQTFKLLTLEEYADLVATSLAMLPPNTVVHRLTSDPPKDSLIAPLWLLEKHKVLQSIHQKMKEKDLYQGKNFRSKNNFRGN
ncbi:MAG: TIGR01212 family radical SAM protein, partial [Caldimicrobium sp.]